MTNKLSNEFKVGLLILDLKHPVVFSDIVLMLMADMTPEEANIATDHLDNIGMLKENFIERNNHNIRQIFLSKKGTEFFKIIKNMLKE